MFEFQPYRKKSKRRNSVMPLRSSPNRTYVTASRKRRTRCPMRPPSVTRRPCRTSKASTNHSWSTHRRRRARDPCVSAASLRKCTCIRADSQHQSANVQEIQVFFCEKVCGCVVYSPINPDVCFNGTWSLCITSYLVLCDLVCSLCIWLRLRSLHSAPGSVDRMT